MLSTLCCCVFQKFNADFDLSAREGADSLAFISLMEEKLTPALVRNQESPCGAVTDGQSDDSVLTVCLSQIYAFWVEPKNYVDVTRSWYAEHLPFPLNFFLPGRMQRHQLDKLRLLRGDESLEAGEEVEKEVRRPRSRNRGTNTRRRHGYTTDRREGPRIHCCLERVNIV